MSYTALNGHGCDTVLNAHATMEDKVMTQKNSGWGMHHMKIS